MTWPFGPEIFTIGPLTLRWYGLLFASGFVIGYFLMIKMFRNEHRPEEDVSTLTWYMVLGTVIGARLGHCFFYAPEYYLSHPIEILKVWEGGLASHGAAIGIFIALRLYSKGRRGQSYLWIFDRVVITVALAAAFIRTGNLFNSEIIGKPATVPWAIIFPRVDQIPRHPTQIYEALAYLIIFIILYRYYWSKKGAIPEGRIFGWFLTLVFGFRIFVEFYKENQSDFEAGMILNMGQLLSIPLVIIGVYFLLRKSPIPEIPANKKGTTAAKR